MKINESIAAIGFLRDQGFNMVEVRDTWVSNGISGTSFRIRIRFLFKNRNRYSFYLYIVFMYLALERTIKNLHK